MAPSPPCVFQRVAAANNRRGNGECHRHGQRHRCLDDDDDRFFPAGGIGEEAFGEGKVCKPRSEEDDGPRYQRGPKGNAADRRCIYEAGHAREDPHRRKDRSALEGAPRLIRAIPQQVNADDDPDRWQQPGEKRERLVGTLVG